MNPVVQLLCWFAGLLGITVPWEESAQAASPQEGESAADRDPQSALAASQRSTRAVRRPPVPPTVTRPPAPPRHPPVGLPPEQWHVDPEIPVSVPDPGASDFDLPDAPGEATAPVMAGGYDAGFFEEFMAGLDDDSDADAGEDLVVPPPRIPSAAPQRSHLQPHPGDEGRPGGTKALPQGRPVLPLDFVSDFADDGSTPATVMIRKSGPDGSGGADWYGPSGRPGLVLLEDDDGADSRDDSEGAGD